MAEIFFWCSGLLLVHTYLLYPGALLLLDRVAARRKVAAGDERRPPFEVQAASRPFVSLVVAAHNEEACLPAKLRNMQETRYPVDRLEILIGSDGSTDRTDEIVQGATDPRVRLVRLDRSGKASVLNRCIPLSRGEIVVLSDANTLVDPEAVAHLVNCFEDPDVGAACGRLVLEGQTSEQAPERSYWSYETAIKAAEGRRGSLIGANGGLYAIRRRLYSPLPPGTITDDFVISMRLLARGFKVVFEPRAVGREEAPRALGVEFGRRARIAAGNFQCLGLLGGLLVPTAGFNAFAFWSHKVLRWFAPALWIVLGVTSGLLVNEGLVYRAIFLSPLVLCGLALGHRLRVLGGGLDRLGRHAAYFLYMNAAMAVGFVRHVRRTQGPTWERTARA